MAGLPPRSGRSYVTVRTRGAEDFQAAIDGAEATAERLRRDQEELERKAAAAWHLCEVFSRRRDAARLTYVGFLAVVCG